MEKGPHFDRIIGGTDADQEQFAKKLEQFAQVSGSEIFGELLVQPTPQEKSAIEMAATYANSIAENFGATKQLPSERIFLLKKNGVKKSTKGRLVHGVCNVRERYVAVDRPDSAALLSMYVVHEVFHMACSKGYQLRIKNDDTPEREVVDGPYRNGISMYGREREGVYFGVAEEAIIATLTKDFFMNVISKLPQYKEELERTAAIKSWVIDHIRSRKDLEQSEIDANIAYFKGILILPDSLPCYEYIADTSKPDEQRLGFFMGYFDDALKSGTVVHERADEREKFEKLLDRITTASNDKIRKEDLFHEFARAHFTGNYLPLARTVEGVLGQGTFRQIAIELGEMKKKSK